MARRKPFSGKKKKEQLKAKRHIQNIDYKKSINNTDYHKRDDTIKTPPIIITDNVTSINSQPVNIIINQNNLKINDRNRFNLQFEKESKNEIEARKLLAQQPIIPIKQIDKEISINDIYPPIEDFNIIKRPYWNYNMSKEEVEKREEITFKNYVTNLKNNQYKDRLSHFEHNLETWRQLWRVLERSNIIMMIMDARFPAFHFCLPLYQYIVNELKKPLILILNKIDAVPLENVIGWKQYFENNYPNLKVTIFTSYPKDPNNYQVEEGKVLKRQKLNKKRYANYGCLEILECCQQLLGANFDLGQWRQKILDDRNQFFKSNNTNNNLDPINNISIDNHDYMTIGMVGYPNVGKSSVINALMGKHVVSISRTPGHTKYFQTIFLTKNVCLCDCPGIIFPSLIDKPFQILAGVYPIAQVQEPYTAVGYLAARVDLPTLLQLKHPIDIEQQSTNTTTNNNNNNYQYMVVTPSSSYQCTHPWSAWDICTSWAYKRGYMTAKSGRPDVYRAANNILKLSLEGKLNMYMLPIGFTSNYETIKNDPYLNTLKQNLTKLHLWKNNPT